MYKRTKWIIGIGSLISLIAIVAPIYFYINDFHDLPRSSNPSDWGTFGDFFGGILNPIISLLTLIVTILIAFYLNKIEKRNHDENVHTPVKPLFTIGAGDFFSSDISVIGPTLNEDFYDYTPPQSPASSYDYKTKQFYLKVSNKGLGIANQVSVAFEIDLNELKNVLIIDDSKIKISATDVKTDEDKRKFIALKIDAAHFNYQGFFYKILEKEIIWKGVVDKGEDVQVVIPSQIIGAFQFFNFIRKLKNTDKTFPIITVTFNYKNIHDKPLSTKFKVGLFHVHDYLRYSIFRILQEQA